VRELERSVLELGARGLVLHHHFQGTVVDDPRMGPIAEAARRLGVPVFVHVLATSLLESPYRLERLAHAHPDTTFVALDGFSSPAQAGEMAPMASRCPNVFFDTGVLTAVAHGLAAFIDEVGPGRLLFGTDFYSSPRLFHVPFPLYEVLNMGLSDDELGLVLGGNTRRLLGVS
jgi:predicted TIM-barrel fold metal-dependent hydrolase